MSFKCPPRHFTICRISQNKSGQHKAKNVHSIHKYMGQLEDLRSLLGFAGGSAGLDNVLF
jgi:hypothetical protein